MRSYPLLLAFILGLAAVPMQSQEWCEVASDPFPPHASEEALPKADSQAPVIELLALAIPEAGPLTEVRKYAAAGVDTLNEILANSQIPGSVRLLDVISAPPSVPYRPYRDGDPNPLSYSFDAEVQRLRDEYGADLVTLVVPRDMLSTFNYGIAYLARSSFSGYSVIRVDVLASPGNAIFAHEIGHNLGLVHDKANAGTDGGPYAPRAYGHWGQLPDGRWFQDVMSYGSACPSGCTVGVNFFANPEIVYLGAPMGVVGDREGALFLRSDAMRRVASWRRSKAGDCIAGPTHLCLGGSRFRVEATWQTSQGTGDGRAVALTADSGYFWFFDQGNVEVVVKVLNACGYNKRYWVYAAGLTDLKVTLTVTDTATDTVKTYVNPQGESFQPILDSNALATCE